MQDTVSVDRNRYIGGSDIPAIMNISPFKKRFDLLMEKAGLRESDFKGNAYTEFGNTLEPKIREYINREYKKNFVEGKHFHPLYINGVECEDISCRCHTDGETRSTILEIKTTSIEDFAYPVSSYPDYLVQLLYYMHMNGRKNGMLAIYDRPDDMDTEFDENRLIVYKIKLEDYTDKVNEIVAAVEKFLIDLEQVKANPSLAEEDLLPVAVQDISNKMLRLEEQLFLFKEVEKAYESEKAKLLQAMRDNGIRSWKTKSGISITAVPAVEPRIDYKTVFNTEAFKAKHPKLYKKFTEDEEVRINGKKAYLTIRHPKEK